MFPGRNPRTAGAGAVLDGRYRLIEPLGRGGSATVWRGRDERLNRVVAVKILDVRLLGDPLACGRLRVETQALATLTHPHIAQVYDVSTVDRAFGPPK